MHVPDIAIASNNHGLGLPPGTIFQGTAPAPTNGLVAVAPPPNTAPTRDPSRRVVRGLVPAPAGSLHSLIVREAPRVKVNPADVSKTKAAIRQAERNQSAAETAWAATTTGTNPQGDKDKLLAARDAADVVAKHRARLVELEASAASRPIRVQQVTVREPSEVPDALASGETAYVCLHDGCKHERWASEADMRRAHPSAGEMARLQQTHVYVLLSEAPLDPLDPDGEKVGYIACIGRDGTTVQQAIQRAEEGEGASAEDVEAIRDENAAMRVEVAELRAMMAEFLAAQKATPANAPAVKK